MITVPVVAWLAAVFALPLTCVVLAQTRLSLARMRVVSVAAATLLVVVAAAPIFAPAVRTFGIAPPSLVPGKRDSSRMWPA